jgi:PIN domain nuclease of toxin-antitoxin system
MKILIDTHVFLWGIQDGAKLSKRVQALLPAEDVWISVASLWEMMAKVQVGKLVLPTPVGEYLSRKLKENGVSVLALTFAHVKKLEKIPWHHCDPFDRILIAQSLEEKLPLVTSDPLFKKYPVQSIWE